MMNIRQIYLISFVFCLLILLSQTFRIADANDFLAEESKPELARLDILSLDRNVHGSAKLHPKDQRDFEDDDCNQQNKQKSLYGHPVYIPTLKDNPAIKASTKTKGMLVEPLRKFGNRGIYAATQMHTKQVNGDEGCGGYFGVQWEGKDTKKDQMLFSIWDKEKHSEVISLALPNHENCYRNNNDGAGTGTQCKYQFPHKLEEKDEIELQVEREPVESLIHNNREYKGHVWTVKARYASGPNKSNFMERQFNGLKDNDEFILGRILFTDDDLEIGETSPQGITDLDMFHEHIGCTICGSFSFEEERSGPYITEAIDNSNVPQIEEGNGSFGCPWKDYDCTCLLFDIKSYEFGKFSFQGGSGSTPHWDAKNDAKMYWTAGGQEHAFDESDCVDTLSTIECTEAKDVGECENIDWAVQNCARTCDLCCGLC